MGGAGVEEGTKAPEGFGAKDDAPPVVFTPVGVAGAEGVIVAPVAEGFAFAGAASPTRPVAGGAAYVGAVCCAVAGARCSLGVAAGSASRSGCAGCRGMRIERPSASSRGFSISIETTASRPRSGVNTLTA